MKTLTQVWLIVMTICFMLLILGFQFGGRVGLFISFLTSIILVYLIMFRGLKLFIKITSAKEISGSDPSFFKNYLNDIASLYNLHKVNFYVTESSLPPLVWSEFSQTLVVIISSKTLSTLTLDEKKLLSHICCAHGVTYSHLTRRFFGLLALASSRLNILIYQFMSLMSFGFSLHTEQIKGDQLAFKNSLSSPLVFTLLLHKLHYLESQAESNSFGLSFFSILNLSRKKWFKLYKLNSRHTLINREKHILGYSFE